MFNKSLFLTIICLGCWIQNIYSGNRVIITRRGKEINKIEKTQNAKQISYRMVMFDLEQWRKSITEGDRTKKRPLGAMDYTVFASHVDFWLQDRDLELNTKIDRTWFVKIKAMFLYMSKTKRFLEHAKMDGEVNAEQVAKKRESFVKAYDQLSNLIANPKKISKKTFVKLTKEKKRREMRRKK